MTRFNVFRNWRVHVMGKKCGTCIFRPGSLMKLDGGRVAEMVREATAEGTAIICHATLEREGQAVCRGFFEKHPTPALQVAGRMGVIEWDKP